MAVYFNSLILESRDFAEMSENWSSNISFDDAIAEVLRALNKTDQYGNLSCPEPTPISTERFYMVAVFGTLCASVSSLENLFVFILLLSNAQYRKNHFLYLIFLALCDFLLSVIYFPLVSVDRLKEYVTGLTSLARLWVSYFGPALMTAHVLKSWSGFLILIATIERFLVQKQVKSAAEKVKSNRIIFVVATFVLALALKGPVVMEIQLEWRPNCPPDSLAYDIRLSELTNNYWYGTVYRFYIRNIFSVFVPFIFLSYFNLVIVCALRKRGRKASLFRIKSKQHRVQARSATRMMLLVVCTYLGSNVLNVILTAWEHIDIMSLMIDHRKFYSISSDLVSILSIAACGLRVPIYLAYNPDMRTAAANYLFCFHGSTESNKAVSVKRSGETCDFDQLAMMIALDFRPPVQPEDQQLTEAGSTSDSDEESPISLHL